jgi:hypothetical protein
MLTFLDCQEFFRINDAFHHSSPSRLAPSFTPFHIFTIMNFKLQPKNTQPADNKQQHIIFTLFNLFLRLI